VLHFITGIGGGGAENFLRQSSREHAGISLAEA